VERTPLGRLHRERGDAGCAEERVRCEDHQVRRDSGSDEGSKPAMVRTVCMGFQGWKRAKIGTLKIVTFGLSKGEFEGIQPYRVQNRKFRGRIAVRKAPIPIS